MISKKIFFLSSLVFLVLTLNLVSAIGITPGRTTINFEPGLEKSIQFTVLNSEHKDMSVVFSVSGNLSEFVTLEQAYAEFNSSEASKSFSYTIKLPSNLDKPGIYETEIMAMEMPANIKERGSFVGATLGVATQLRVYVPYPDKYAEASFDVSESKGNIVFSMPVVNRGKINISEAKAVIDIYSSANEKIETLESSAVSVESLSRADLLLRLDSSVLNSGKYFAKAVLFYDDEQINLEKSFEVGQKIIEIKKIDIGSFNLGEIVKFETLVENEWPEEFNNTHLTISVFDNSGKAISEIKSPPYILPSLGKIEMVSYWDTSGFEPGEYDGKILLKYNKDVIEKDIKIEVSKDSIKISGLTGNVVGEKQGFFNLTNILITIIVFLVVINLIWFFIIRIFSRKK